MRRWSLAIGFTTALTLAAIPGLTPPVLRAAAPADPADPAAIAHVLNRMGFGPRPGDIQKVQTLGLEQYIEQQLRPDRIADEAVTERLEHLRTLNLSSREIAERFERPFLEARRARRADANAAPAPPNTAGTAPSSTEMMTPRQRPDNAGQAANTLVAELTEQKLVRAIFSERQLQEVLTDFWFNHFNVDSRKGRVRFMVTPYERDAIRPHVLGSFRDLLGATAKSPAMLFYLDNWMSAAAPTAAGRARPRAQLGPRAGRGRMMPPGQAPERPARTPRGLNENYGRELLELHTLGVDGGYTQRDVTEVARAFTGWTITNPQQGATFQFDPRRHDSGDKTVLGHKIAGGGQRDGEQVLDILAAHPATARFIATKLVRRFVSDTPPPTLVDRAAARFIASRGDLRDVMRTILTAPEFLAPAARHAKVKTPFEFVVSAVRSTGLDHPDPRALGRALQQLGMPLYQCQPPTGYKDTAEAWTNTGALVGRMNFALTVAQQVQRSGLQVDVNALIHGGMSDPTRTTIAKAPTAPQALALALGSPEFQKR